MTQYDLGQVVGSQGAKGDTGNGITSITKTSTSGLIDTYTITYTDGSTSTFTVTNGSDASVTIDTALSSTSTNPVQNKVINTALDGKASSSHTHTKSQITDFPTIPSKLSDLTNDSDFIEKSATSGLIKNDGTVMTSGTGASNYSAGNHTHSGYASSTHTHGNLSNDGKIGTTSGKPLITTTGGAITTGSFGSTSGTFAEGNHTHSGMLTTSDIYDGLDSSSTNKALSAKQGKVLGDMIGSAITYIVGSGS